MNELLKILKRQYSSVLKVLLTLPIYSKDTSQIESVLRSYDTAFYDYFDNAIYQIVKNSISDGIPVYCGDKEITKVDDIFLEQVKLRIRIEGILNNFVNNFQEYTVNKVLDEWWQYQNKHRNIDLLLDNLEPLFGKKRADFIWDRAVSLFYGIGQFELAKMLDIKTKKWVTKHDAFVRDLHKQRDGMIVPLDGLILGARYPRDPRLPPEDRENCRCHLEFC